MSGFRRSLNHLQVSEQKLREPGCVANMRGFPRGNKTLSWPELDLREGLFVPPAFWAVHLCSAARLLYYYTRFRLPFLPQCVLCLSRRTVWYGFFSIKYIPHCAAYHLFVFLFLNSHSCISYCSALLHFLWYYRILPPLHATSVYLLCISLSEYHHHHVPSDMITLPVFLIH